MAQSIDLWKSWNLRLRIHISEKNENLEKVAERLGRAESTLRSWMNGNREINLSEFFELCKQAKADPAQILFGQPIMSEDVRKQIGALASSIMEADPASNPDYLRMSRSLKRRPAKAPDGKKRKRRVAATLLQANEK